MTDFESDLVTMCFGFLGSNMVRNISCVKRANNFLNVCDAFFKSYGSIQSEDPISAVSYYKECSKAIGETLCRLQDVLKEIKSNLEYGMGEADAYPKRIENWIRNHDGLLSSIGGENAETQSKGGKPSSQKGNEKSNVVDFRSALNPEEAESILYENFQE